MINNHTVYRGLPYLTFEKYPFYVSKSKLNKVHLDLGFTKLVSRVKIDKKDPYDKFKINLINQNTGGKISTYKWWLTEDLDSNGEYLRVTTEPTDKNTILSSELELNDSFLSHSGEYIGDASRGWFYFKNKLLVCNEYPRGVAIQMCSHRTIVQGYYGYSHRAGQLFKIGDRLFDEKYIPVEDDFEEWEWVGYQLQYEEFLNKFSKDYVEGVVDFIPYRRRGKIEITTLEQAKQAAINISQYLG